MGLRTFIFTCILNISAMMPVLSRGQNVKVVLTDSVEHRSLVRNVAVSVDVLGAAMAQFSDYGQYEASLRVNLGDKYFPVVELGYGTGEHAEDAVTGISAKSSAPFGRIGCDFNVKKDKHDGYRLFAGFRYAYTSFKSSIAHDPVADPVWGGTAPFGTEDEKNSYHWGEGVFGVDVLVVANLRMGWSVRYRRRLAHSKPSTGKLWYVPGYGTDTGVHWRGLFNVTFEL